ncbi:DUF3086 domain-containing protein [Waterburya agarophytonicola K14]|uniref:DUF3086 domain-containing protein n=1 Tax=Waterburya agarophytonicola KI4 TaxID=2874699 RepID=A0A964BU69_9CYAN|nr:DUF3086 domain-containing protein [Waterburya agarophytonicola]MCC0179748.1 DUF3086 domain-containing protein [Waterburya agarophytonicola KI4]
MNSEIPPIPESENSKSNSTESGDLPLEESKVESTSDIDDAWLEDGVDDIIDVSVEPETEIESSQLQLTNSSNTELDLSATNTIEELTPVETDRQQNTEIVDNLSESELFVDSWLDEPKADAPLAIEDTPTSVRDEEIDRLQEQKASLEDEIEALKTQKEQMLLQQVREVQENMAQMIEEGTRELKERKTSLQIEIEKLERRKDRINQEMRANFAGSSQELAVKVQGFKEYLVGSLQDLARAADKLDLAKTETPPRTPSRIANRDEEMATNRDRRKIRDRGRTSRENIDTGNIEYRNNRDSRSGRDSRRNIDRGSAPSPSQGQFSESTFADQSRRIRQLIDQYRNNPDYYGSPWQLRRTFEPIHAKKVQDWFFVQGGRGAIDSMGSRLQNILVASAAVSILHNIYGDRCRVLVLTDTPENLGEWRRGLQDCLGISRSNFGSNRGVTLFDSPEVAVQRAERLIEEKLLPVIIIDETEELLNLSVLKFPIWLAFASSAKPTSTNYLY